MHFFKESETVENLSKSEFKELLFLAPKDPDFIFDGTLYKQIGGVAMGSSLGLTLANAFLVYLKKIGQNVVHSNKDQFTIEGTLMMYLFYLIYQNI